MAPTTVLLVEDNVGDAYLTRHALETMWGEPLEIVHVQTAGAACEQIANRPWDCVLLDLSLPDAHGLQAFDRVLRSDGESAIVVLSGLADDRVALEAVQRGAQDYIVKGRLDIENFARAVRYAVERKRTELELQHHALHDQLTGLPNRTLLLDRISQAISRLPDSGSCALLLVDLDAFAHVNDSYGHEAGDRVLLEVAERLRGVVRVEDTVACLGGDGFVLLCEGLAGFDGASTVARATVDALATPMPFQDGDTVLSSSIGIALAHPGIKAERLLADADQAMRRAKLAGGASVELADAGARDRLLRRMRTESALRRAIERDELRLCYQPTIELATGQVVGAEALVRWERDGALVAPLDFIPLAEETGLIHEIGAWVLAEACRAAAIWSAYRGRSFEMAVNLSACQLADAQLPVRLREIVQTSGVDPASLCLEITESVGVEDAEHNRAAVSALRAEGVRLALDDFGTGYASLSFLKRFPFDVLKVDRGFVTDLGGSGEDATIVAAVLALAKARGLVAVAEGVETVGTRDALVGLGCERAQGFLFSHALPAAEFSALL